MKGKCKKVLVTSQIMDEGLKLLRESGLEVRVHDDASPLTKEELSREANEVHALLTMLSDQVDETFLQTHPHLQVITNYAVGFNNIDVKTASAMGIPVGNTPDVLTEATAEVALGLMIAAARNFKSAAAEAENGLWKKWEPMGHLGHGLQGKILGIIGMGRIGRCFAEMAKGAFKMKILTLSRHDLHQGVSFDELLKTSDVISLHTPLTDETRRLIGTREFSIMKNSCILVNTSRGEIIDQEALYEALSKQKIFAAGLDVTSPEPLPASHPLFTLKNCFILPHIGSATLEARRAMSIIAAKNILLGLEKKKGYLFQGHFVNKKELEKNIPQ